MDFDAFCKKNNFTKSNENKILDNISEYLCYLNSDEDMRK